jgi:glycyl-tRNA synthetase alpha chain
VGWQIWLDEMEITQFTYFQQIGGLDLDPVSVELTYGLERIAMFLQGAESAFELLWSEHVRYGEIWLDKEREFSIYNFERASVERIRKIFELCEAEAKDCLAAGLVFPAYDQTLRCSHLFNVLDARGAISVTERESYIARIRALARGCAEGYLAKLEERSEAPV